MRLTKFEQSGFIFETNSGFRLAVDIGNKTPLDRLDAVSCDAMLISHIHGDHFSLDQIKKLSPKKLYLNSECKENLGEEALSFEILEIKEETIEIEGNTIEIFNVDHGPNVSSPVKENFGFLFTIDNQKIYFAGDMFYSSGIDVSDLEVDIALIPVGGFYTFGPEEAVAFAKQFKKIGKIVPMHYEKTLETKQQFTDLAVKEGFNIDSRALI